MNNMRSREDISKEIRDLKKKLLELESELSDRRNYVLMYMVKHGKHTFVLQPIKQKDNLLQNGWKLFSRKLLDTFLDGYDL